ncbi:MAG: hypothetical protein ACRBDL_03920 [Alphaproteobacteria bacterium]
MRRGPHPLPVHLGMVASNMQDIQKYALDAQFSLSQDQTVDVLRGIKMYQEHPFSRPDMAVDVVWKSGKTRLLRPVVESRDTLSLKQTLIVIPSLINSSDILDISTEQSFVRWCVNNGIDTYLVDWGDLSAEPDLTIEDIVVDRLSKLIQFVSKKEGKPVDVMGYCMGGTLLAGTHHVVSDHIRRMVFLAAPWNFHAPSFEFARLARVSSLSILPVIKEKSLLPPEYVQSLFAVLDPKAAAQKFMRFSDMDQESAEARLFVSVEDWLNNGVALPGNIAQHCIQEWFLDNRPYCGTWSIGQKRIDMEAIQKECLILASSSDKIVPIESAAAITENILPEYVSMVELSSGHIGLIVGRHAQRQVWARICDFLQKK